MGELRLFALSIHEVRDMFGADEALAGRLRGIASDSFKVPAAERRPQGLLGKIGPLFRRGAESVIPHDVPLPADWEKLISAQFVAPDRVDVSWKVIDAWIDDIDHGTETFTFDQRGLDDFDFALTKAGLPARFGLRKLMADEPQLPVMPATGMQVGYGKHGLVMATIEELAKVVGEVDDDERENARRLHDFLAKYPAWTEAAASTGRPKPDLFVIWRDCL